MKKVILMVVVLVMALNGSAALAADMGVQPINPPELETEPVSLDDIKLNVPFTIDGYGEFTPTTFSWVDSIKYYKVGNTSDSDYYSGADAQYALLRFDITNINTKTKNFLEAVEVKAVYDDLYEYVGWYYQYDYNHGSYYSGRNNREIVILKEDFFNIDPMYTGHYCFGCTLPTAVVEGKKALKLIIYIDGNEITYNIRK